MFAKLGIDGSLTTPPLKVVEEASPDRGDHMCFSNSKLAVNSFNIFGLVWSRTYITDIDTYGEVWFAQVDSAWASMPVALEIEAENVGVMIVKTLVNPTPARLFLVHYQKKENGSWWETAGNYHREVGHNQVVSVPRVNELAHPIILWFCRTEAS